jgi:hypothetical protein
MEGDPVNSNPETMTERPAAEVLDAALAWLAGNPDSSARTVAAAIGERDDRYVFMLLDNAAYKGRCQRWRAGIGTAWLWEVPKVAEEVPR